VEFLHTSKEYQRLLAEPPPSIEENQLLINKAIEANQKIEAKNKEIKEIESRDEEIEAKKKEIEVEIEAKKKEIEVEIENRWKLITRNIRLVLYVAGKHSQHSQVDKNANDMVADGLLGFYDAVCRLKACVPQQFVSYSIAHMEFHIKSGLSKKQSAFNNISERTRFVAVSIDETQTKPDGQESFSLETKLCEKTQPDVSELVEDKDMAEFSRKVIRDICSCRKLRLTPGDREAFLALAEEGGNKNQAAKSKGVSRECMGQRFFKCRKEVIRYCVEKYGWNELQDMFGIKGRTPNSKLSNPKSFRYTVQEIDRKHHARKQVLKQSVYGFNGSRVFSPNRKSQYLQQLEKDYVEPNEDASDIK